MHPKVRFTPTAAALLQSILKQHRNLVLLLDDTSCCSNSNVMLRENEPSWPVSVLAEVDGVRILLNPVLEKRLKAELIIIDALDFSDDSLSLETDFGKRFTMSIEHGLAQDLPSSNPTPRHARR